MEAINQIDLIKTTPEDQLERLKAIIRRHMAEVDGDIMEAYDISPVLLDTFNSIYFDKLRVEVIDHDFFRIVLLWNRIDNVKFSFVFDDMIEGCAVLMTPNDYNENTALDLLDKTVTLGEKLFTDYVTVCESFDYTTIYDSEDPELSLEDLKETATAPKVMTDFLSHNNAEKFKSIGTVMNYIQFMNGNSISCNGRVVQYADGDPDINYVCTYVKDGNVLILRTLTTPEMECDILTLIGFKEDNFTPLSYREVKKLYNEVVREIDTYNMHSLPGVRLS